MKIHVITYTTVHDRLSTVKKLLAELSGQGLKVEVFVPSHATADLLRADLSVPVRFSYGFSYSVGEADVYVAVDADLMIAADAAVFEKLGRDVYFIVPPDVLPPVGPSSVIKNLIESLNEFFPLPLFPEMSANEPDKPKTFGCHHFRDTCRQCESSVMRWKSTRRDALLTAPEAD